MLKEIKQEIKFIINHPLISFLVVGTITGFIPAILMGIVTKIF